MFIKFSVNKSIFEFARKREEIEDKTILDVQKGLLEEGEESFLREEVKNEVIGKMGSE